MRCSYDTSAPAETRVQAIKRKQADLDDRIASLVELFDLLREGTALEASETLRLIRAGADAESVVRHTKTVDFP